MVTLNLRLDEDVHRAMREKARSEGLSLNQAIVAAIRQSLGKHDSLFALRDQLAALDILVSDPEGVETPDEKTVAQAWKRLGPSMTAPVQDVEKAAGAMLKALEGAEAVVVDMWVLLALRAPTAFPAVDKLRDALERAQLPVFVTETTIHELAVHGYTAASSRKVGRKLATAVSAHLTAPAANLFVLRQRPLSPAELTPMLERNVPLGHATALNTAAALRPRINANAVWAYLTTDTHALAEASRLSFRTPALDAAKR